MYLSINITLIILLYQCLMIYSFRNYMERYQSVLSSKSGFDNCLLPIPGKNNPKIPYIHPIPESLSVFSSNNESITIKHNTVFKIACTSGKFKSPIDEDVSEITVQCLSGRSVKYKHYAFEYDYFECDDIQKLKSAQRAFRNTFIPKARKLRRIRKNDCVMRLQKAHIRMPIIFTLNKPMHMIVHPDKNGRIVISHNETFKMSCVGSRFTYPSRCKTEITVTCLNTSFIQYRSKTYGFEKFRCLQIPKSSMIVTNRTCQTMDNEIYDVGFQTEEVFLTVYKICFDVINKNNVYSWNTFITPIFHKRQMIKKKIPEFTPPIRFGDTDIFALYNNQTEMVKELVQSEKLSKILIRNDQELDIYRNVTPGILLTPSEFNYISEQNSAYYYENTAPQWYEYNVGVWSDVEKMYRRCMAKNRYKHVVITGSYGRCMLPDKFGVLRPMYLSTSKKIMTVPEFIWRMDYNLDREAGIVFIVLNNPYKKVDKNIYFCEAIACPGLLKRKGIHSWKGFLFCCTKAAFEKVYGRIDPIVYWDYIETQEPKQFTGIL